MLRCSSRINFHDQPPSSLGLVRKDFVQEPSYPRISKTLVQPGLCGLTIRQKLTRFILLGFVAFCHIGNFKVFYKDNLSLVDQLTCKLKMPLFALSSYLLM